MGWDGMGWEVPLNEEGNGGGARSMGRGHIYLIQGLLLQWQCASCSGA